jgi:hypothetical protein
MVTSGRAAALILFAGLFAATLGGQADAASTTAVGSRQDDSLPSRDVESAMLRGVASTRGAAAARRLQEDSFESFMDAIDSIMADDAAEDPYRRRSLMSLRND